MPGAANLNSTLSANAFAPEGVHDPESLTMTPRERFLRACRCVPLDHPPIWLMRQAGRALPEYRALKEKYSFLELVRTPELATEVTLQPIRRFGFDAAILFCDILVIPEALGQGYSFREGGGIQMDFELRDRRSIEQLSPSAIAEKLDYVFQALRMIKGELADKTALIGFAGSPWTLANFMLEGGGCKEPRRALQLLRQEPAVFKLLAEKLTIAIIEYLKLQIAAGAEAVQIFDTHGGLLPWNLFRAGSGVWMQRIVHEIGQAAPVIVFSKGTRNWPELSRLGARVLGVDHGTSLQEARQALGPAVALQGNFDPNLLSTEPGKVRQEAGRLLGEMRGVPGWIFNLGHGVPPEANLDCMAALIDTVRSFS
jgi:uroporphyrinogen decarboxylase